MVIPRLRLWKFSHKKTLQQTLFDGSWVLLQKTKIAFWTTLWGLKGNVRTPSIARWKVHSQLPVHHNWTFYPNVTIRYDRVFVIANPSVVSLSVVCNVGTPYSGGWTFRQYFFTAVYAGHPLTSVQNFMEVVPRKPLHRGR